jgi:diguanylate cyclase (GGDEF)-like protein
VPAATRHALVTHGISVYPELGRTFSKKVAARKLALEVEPVAPDADNDTVYARFDANPDLMAVPVVRDGKPVGLIQRHSVIDRFARPYRREIYGRRACTMLMDAEPLVVDGATSVQELGLMVIEGERRYLADGFIITDRGRYLGIASGHDLMREITQMQIAAARYANPLTLLPGNVPISEHLGRLLDSGVPFSACHCDLDNFKPYNDVYGYQKGDEIIILAARVLGQVCDPERDFLGHIGGDDFMLLFQNEDWEARCRTALKAFGESLAAMLPEAVRARGGVVSEDRRGQDAFYPFPSLSIGAVVVERDTPATHLGVSAAAAEAKKLAKRIPGNSLFVERRRLFS